ncbi:MAG: PQQ-binding-like beta-propeller repeat protein [Phycisphaerae bacterium]
MGNSTVKVLAALVGLAGAALAADWPQFQGPDRSGVSPETGLLKSWPEGGPKVAWRIDDKLGRGFAGAVVQGGKAYLLDNDAGNDILRCIDLASGRQEWTFKYPCEGKYKGNYNGSRNLPAVDDKNIYILSPYGEVRAISKEKHDEALWVVNLVEEYEMKDKGGERDIGNWGVCQSPVLYKDTVIVAPLTRKAGIVALDKATGKEVWKSERLGQIAWTSPAISTVEGVDQVVMLHTRDKPRLTGLDAATGKVLWQYSKWECPNPIASHTDCGNGRFFITGGYAAGCAMVQVKKDGDKWTAEEVFQNKDLSAQACKPVFYKDHIYAASNSFPKAPQGVNETPEQKKQREVNNGLMCMDLKGQVKWKTGGTNEEEIGSIIIADGMIYNFLSEKGVLRLIVATPDEFKLLSEVRAVPKDMKAQNLWAPMALADGKLLIRYNRNMVCYDLKGE